MTNLFTVQKDHPFTFRFTEKGCHSDILYIPNAFSEAQQKRYLTYLHTIKDWKTGQTTFGSGQVPRLQKWFHSDLQPFTTCWRQQFERWQAHPYDSTLSKIQNEILDTVQRFVPEIEQEEFNSILLNRYRNGLDSIKPHQDSVPEFGENPTVICVSLGETRTIVFSRIDSQKEIEIPLESGSILLMKGSTQKHFRHGIPKTSQEVGERFSLTIRRHTSLVTQ